MLLFYLTPLWSRSELMRDFIGTLNVTVPVVMKWLNDQTNYQLNQIAHNLIHNL